MGVRFFVYFWAGSQFFVYSKVCVVLKARKELQNRPLGTQLFEWRDNNYHKNNGLGLCAEPAEGTTFPHI